MAEFPQYWINGIFCEDTGDVRGPKWAIDPDSPPRQVAVPGVQGTSIPGRDGSLWTPQGAALTPLWTVTLTILGNGDTRDERIWSVEQTIDMWITLASAARVPLRQQLGPVPQLSSSRHAIGRLKDITIDRHPVGLGANLESAKMTMIFELPGVYWSDVEAGGQMSIDVNRSYPTAGAPAVMVNGNPGTAPMQGAQIMIWGPASNFTITNYGSGDFCRYKGSVSSSQSLLIDCEDMRVFLGTRAQGWFTPQQAAANEQTHNAEFGNNSGWYMPTTMRVQPSSPTAGAFPANWHLSFYMNGDGFNSSTQIFLRGRRGYR